MALKDMLGPADVFFPKTRLLLFNKEVGYVEPNGVGAYFTASQVKKLSEWSLAGLDPYLLVPQDDGRILVKLKGENQTGT